MSSLTEIKMIRIVQYLCPQRHAIMAACFDTDNTTPKEAEESILRRLMEMNVATHCGICHANELHFEHGRTKFKTMAEAEPHLLETERMNRWSRWWIDYQKFLASRNN